jgi:integrase
MSNLSLVDFFQAPDAENKFEVNKENWPWLRNISFSKKSIEITDTTGEIRKTSTVALDIKLLDGSKLTDRRNKEFYELVLEYVEVFRLHYPIIGAFVHTQRIRSILTFVCWLSQYKIRSLSKVTTTHLEKFTNDVAFGTEFSLNIPDKVFTAIQKHLLEGKNLPFRQANIIERKEVYEMVGVRGLPIRNFRYTSRILDWYEHQLKHNFKRNLEDILMQDVLEELDLIPNIVTVQNLHGKLIPLEEIWSWQHHFKSKSFPKNPFPDGSSKAASRLGSATKRTRTIPPKVVFSIMRESANWVLNYSDEIVDLYSSEADAPVVIKRLVNKGLKLNIRDGKQKYKDVVTLEGAVRYLAAACFTVIASLTARRKEEIFDLGYKCIDEDRGDGAYWLTIYIEKTSQRYDLCPVPALVKKAIAVLEKLSEKAREQSGNDSLWQYVSSDGKVVQLNGQKVRNSLQDFYTSFVDADLSQEWSFSFHQFRRMFALLYYYRFEGAYIGALSYHLRHFNIDMTKQYITDEKFMKEMKEIGEGWTASFLRRVISGKAKIGGKSGDKIKRKLSNWLKHFRGKVDVVERERVVEKLTRYMKRVGTDFTQQVWGTICTCPKKTSLRKHANCANDEGEPNIAKGSVETCGGCPFAAYTDRFGEAISGDIAAMQKTKSFCEQGSVLDEITGVKIIALQELLTKAESVTPFEVPNESSC